jgi:anti-sigma regulatory factor (Ser/Thr protein kinase)
MDVRSVILKKIEKTGEARVSEVMTATGFSRAYVNRFFQGLREEGKIVLLGQTNKTKYVLAEREVLRQAKKEISSFRHLFKNKDLSEDKILAEVANQTGIFLDLPKNVKQIVEYSLTELLNNAIEHSGSKTIELAVKKEKDRIDFSVIDKGVGIFNHIAKKRKLKNELEAIQDLVKGKQTTAPKEHSGEGIFFTSKAADIMTIQSSKKKLIFNNIVDDIFIKEGLKVKGTKVAFVIGLKSKANLAKIFQEYSEGLFDFGKTKVVVRLYKIGTEYISRSQARRILSGLEKFKKIVLDFKGVEFVGRSFADEIFRVWQKKHPDIKVEYLGANKNIDFTIKKFIF